MSEVLDKNQHISQQTAAQRVILKRPHPTPQVTNR